MAGMLKGEVTGEKILALKASGAVTTLIQLLGHENLLVRSRSADALATMSPSATRPLLDAIGSGDSRVRMGAVYALGSHRDPAVVPALIRSATGDRSIDVRWAALLALGEAGDPAAVPCCVRSLKDPDRYIRYGAANALHTLRWEAGDDAERAYYRIALQDWGSVRDLGKASVGPLLEMLKDKEPSTRMKITDLLSQTGTPEAAEGCACTLKDPRDTVRYQGLLLAIRCGLSAERLPLLIARRERTGPDPAAAAVLNFLFIGIGYNYIGKWWGFLVFMIYMTIIVLAQLQMGPFLPYLLASPVTAIFAIKTYFQAKEIADNGGFG